MGGVGEGVGVVVFVGVLLGTLLGVNVGVGLEVGVMVAEEVNVNVGRGVGSSVGSPGSKLKPSPGILIPPLVFILQPRPIKSKTIIAGIMYLAAFVISSSLNLSQLDGF